MALTTVAKVKEWLSLKVDPPADLQLVLDAASAFVEKYLGFPVLRHTVTEHRDGNGKTEMMLKEHYVLSFTSVTINGQAFPESPDYQQRGWRHADWWIMLQGGEVFPRGRRNITLVYEAGFDVVPADIEQAVIDLCALRYKEKDRIGVQSKTLAAETISFMISDLSQSQRAVLNKYRRVVPV